MREQCWYEFGVRGKEWGDVGGSQDICERIFCGVPISKLSQPSLRLPHLAEQWQRKHHPRGGRIKVFAKSPLAPG